MNAYKKQFNEEIIPKLQKRLKEDNVMAAPRLQKIVVNTSSREFLVDKKNIEKYAEDLMTITGQKPKVVKAKVSVATFKLREGDQIGLVVTLRGDRMYDFFEKLVKIVLPRVKDFSGVSRDSFDGHGNMTMGFSDQMVFPEIDSGKVDRIRSLQMILVTTADTDEQGLALLEEMGMPFKKLPTEVKGGQK
ncbi:MAG TPA: 50S ribosomal protein L5 [Candidatus Levybacteria bacterium]|nr:50S ribosomal protein L5 [Candidatus Levybacteria bacterium]